VFFESRLATVPICTNTANVLLLIKAEERGTSWTRLFWRQLSVLSIRIRINFGRLYPDWQKTPENINKLTKGMGHQWWGGQFYFSFPPKCRKLRTVLQRDANDEEMKKKFKKF
jgi:hypothetical protein